MENTPANGSEVTASKVPQYSYYAICCSVNKHILL